MPGIFFVMESIFSSRTFDLWNGLLHPVTSSLHLLTKDLYPGGDKVVQVRVAPSNAGEMENGKWKMP